MSTHADAVRKAKERVVECACDWASSSGSFTVGLLGAASRLGKAVDEYEALVAQTCEACGGGGVLGRYLSGVPSYVPCPAACDNGRRKEAERG